MSRSSGSSACRWSRSSWPSSAGRNGISSIPARRAPSSSAPWASIAHGRSRRSPISRRSIRPFVRASWPASATRPTGCASTPSRSTADHVVGRTCGIPPSRARSRSRPGTGLATRSSRRSTSRSAAPPTTSISGSPSSRAVQGQWLPAHQQRRAHQAAAGRRRSVAVPLFRRAHRAGGRGRRARRIRHPEGGRALLDLQHRHGGEPAAAKHGARAEIREHQARRRQADRVRPAHRLSARPISTR